ncbi:Putative cyclase [Robiginitalea myxolifaciens]|uniref:Putative cyclase n=1 Tax=Robiginitalea myxolifaciens TaxID=400055 RepID=A0A1I6FUP5_9FLAO|nr:cyclase family protein [Robiginitalea myxolifaciens]SFR33672.1 Putative cyclase [Robiginitalea myxolifaciens]
MAWQRITVGGIEADVDLTAPTDLSLPVSDGGTTAWEISPATISPLQIGEFIGSVQAGGSVNFNNVQFNPHAHGTHTESCGHVLREIRPLTLNPPPALQFAQLLTINEGALDANGGIPAHFFEGKTLAPEITAIILRLVSPELMLMTAPENLDAPANWSGSNPPYLTPAAMQALVVHGIEHLLINLPSVDPEEDGGALMAHRIFWGIGEDREPGPDFRPEATISELLAIPESLEDGIYLLNLQLGPMINDACPSRPIVFPAKVLR